MPIIAILNPKGGAGKSTLTVQLAAGLQRAGKRVLVVDSDQQGSLRDWHAAQDNNPIPFMALDRPSMLAGVKDIAAGYDFTLIDGAAKLEDMLAAGIKAADIVLIPVSPSAFDIWAASDLVDFVKARQEVTEGKPLARFVITQAKAGTILAREVQDAVAEFGLGLMKTTVHAREAYPQAGAGGQTIFDTQNAAGKAEIEALTAELIELAEGAA